MAVAEVPKQALKEYKAAMEAVGHAKWLLSRIAYYQSCDVLSQVVRLVQAAMYHAGRLAGLVHCADVWEPFNSEKIAILADTAYNAVEKVSGEARFLVDVLSGG